jgi:hypothetical protein
MRSIAMHEETIPLKETGIVSATELLNGTQVPVIGYPGLASYNSLTDDQKRMIVDIYNGGIDLDVVE